MSAVAPAPSTPLALAERLSVVIVSHQTRSELRRCLDSLTATDGEVIVVDSGSRDGSAELVRGQYPQARLLALPNVGFGAAVNAGLAQARGEYALVLNADARPLPGAIQALVAAADRHPEAGIVGPRLRGLDGAIQRSVFASPSGPLQLGLWTLAPRLVGGAYAGLQRARQAGVRVRPVRAVPSDDAREAQLELREAEWVQGSAFLARRSAVRAAGGFDERFFMFCEEPDLTRRLHRHGWSVLFVPAAEFTHVGGASTAACSTLMYGEHLRAQLTLIEKYRGRRAGERARRLVLAALRMRSVVCDAQTRERSRAARGRLLAPTPELLRLAELWHRAGVLVSVTGRFERRARRRALERRTAGEVEAVLAIPNARAPLHLLPLRRDPLEHLLGRRFGRLPWLAAPLARLGAALGPVLEALLPGVVLVAPSEAGAAFEWLGASTPGVSHVVSGGWRGAGSAATVTRLAHPGARTELVAKVAPAARAQAEARALASIAPLAASCGISVPRLVRTVVLGDRHALVERALPGRAAAVELAGRPERAQVLLVCLAAWLREWAAASRVDLPLTRDELDVLVLAPARELADLVPSLDAYVEHLAALGDGLIGRPVPRVAAHHDLTMWNVLVGPSGELGVLDWAEAQSQALPLGDLAYAAVDSTAAVTRYRSRPEAFEACFAPTGRRCPEVSALLARAGRALGLDGPTTALCLHGAWLHHARNELRHERGGSGGFVEIVQRLAAGGALAATEAGS